MKEKGMIFTSESVRAIIAGRKTQTRRIMVGSNCPHGESGDRIWVKETFCSPSMNIVGYSADSECGAWNGSDDRFWIHHGYIIGAPGYAAKTATVKAGACRTFGLSAYGGKWRSPRFMPRWASRITLEIVEVRVQRVQEISVSDAISEGITAAYCCSLENAPHVHKDPLRCCRADCCCGSVPLNRPQMEYRELWDEVNGKRATWDSNPLVRAITFRRLP